MAICTCLTIFLVGKKKKYMETHKAADDSKKGSGECKLNVKPIKLSSPSTKDGVLESQFTASKSFSTLEESSSMVLNVPSNDSLARAGSAGDAAYDGSDEQDEIRVVKRDYSEFDLQEKPEIISPGSNIDSDNYAFEFDLQEKGEIVSPGSNIDFDNYAFDNKLKSNEGISLDAMVAGGHVSDLGMEQTSFWASPVLKRSCSNIEIRRVDESMNTSKRSTSYSDLKKMSGNEKGEFSYEFHSSPLSFKTSCSAGHLILKKCASSQVLPSQSRKMWWKLLLWGHRNLQKFNSSQSLTLVISNADQKVGYSSDTHELDQMHDKKKKAIDSENQWVVLSLQSSPQDRVYAWVNSLEDCRFCPIDDDETWDGREGEWSATVHPMEIGESSRNNLSHNMPCAAEEVIQANNIIRSLNSFSSVAHISSMGLKVIPSISAFGSLKSVSLCGNFIVHITPGCLPKNIHTLDLSQNKLSEIEGLRNLTKLRVLNLSYNRISRIGHGLSNCTIIKELYLAGNKISHCEGLHRLLKLTVLDLSFNKITTPKAFGQLVANYNSLLSFNLIGNPIQSNIGEDQIRKEVVSLLPRINYLNKQMVRQHRAREVGANSVANAAFVRGGWNSRRRPTRRLAQGLGSSTKTKIGEGSSKGRENHSNGKQKHSSFIRK